jgi:hypothetical protein
MSLHGSYEAVSATRHRFDIPRILSGIAQHPPKLIHSSVEAVLEINKRPFVPDPLAQSFASNHIAGMGQYGQQNLKRLLGETDANAALEQMPCRNVDFKRSEG